MKKERIEGLADGIFAIIITLLAIDIRVPELVSTVENAGVWQAILERGPEFVSYILAFLVLLTYWRAYYFIMSVYAKNIDMDLINYNFIFFFFLALIPFSTNLLGRYPEAQVSVIIFGVHVILIGIALLIMRKHVHLSPTIEKNDHELIDNRYAYLRIGVPILCAVLAIVISFWSTDVSIGIFVLGILFNLRSSIADHVIRWIYS